MRALEFIRDHVTFKLPYDFSYQMKTPKYYVVRYIDSVKILPMKLFHYLIYYSNIQKCVLSL